MKIGKLNSEIVDSCIEYLNRNAETSMFLLQNIDEHGFKRGGLRTRLSRRVSNGTGFCNSAMDRRSREGRPD